MTETNGQTLIEVQDLKTWFPIRAGFFGRTVGHVKAVDGVSFKIKKGKTQQSLEVEIEWIEGDESGGAVTLG